MRRLAEEEPVEITPQSVVDLAKSALVPVKCDATTTARSSTASGKAACIEEFCSWRSLCRHLRKKHTSGSRRKGFTCQLLRCNARQHAKQESLEEHLEHSHMKAVPLPCPFANCLPPMPDFGVRPEKCTFMKEKDLVSHLQQNHSELVGRILDRHSELLLPSWEPHRPLSPPVPPELPKDIPWASFRLDYLDEPVHMRSGWFSRVADEESTQLTKRLPPPLARTPTPSLTLIPLTPTKTFSTRRPLLRDPSILSIASEPEAGLNLDLPDLEAVTYDPESARMALRNRHGRAAPMTPIDISLPPYFSLRRAGGEDGRIEHARPLPMLHVPIPEKPPPLASIFYEVLRQQVYAQYAMGQDATASNSASEVPPS
ncbi:hypothetical protein R3P38DRAFT_678332 [Favolaschia claudopus]|uniref:C2H2-type domain-containing protein n=1 Tax=Favolaschia claudopus TaxID=2862362 RepID=A0AAW0ECI3_9AGAR